MEDDVKVEINLESFCCKRKDFEIDITKPFNQNGKTWATNGWLLICVPLRDGYVDQGKPDTTDCTAGFKPGQWYQIPEVSVTDCSMCCGKITNFTCPECKGRGLVDLKNDFTQYLGVECASCEGEGAIDFCNYCSGTGVDADMVQIGPATFKAGGLWLIRSLPEIEISPTGPETPAFLRFSGGEGFLMPAKNEMAGQCR